MTREEFLRDINDFYDLKSFCCDMDIDILEDVYDEDGRDDEINRYLAGNIDRYDWEDIRDRLSGIPNGRGWFYENSWDDWVRLDDRDFAYYKQEVLDICDGDSLWDDPCEEDEDEPCCIPSVPSDSFPIPADPDFLSLLLPAVS